MIKKFNVEKTKKLDQLNKLLSLVFRKPVCKFNGSFDDVSNILIIDFALMGDMIMNIPFLTTLKKNCPNAKITMVAMPWAETILYDQNLVDEFIVFDGKNKLSSPKMIIKNLREIRKVLKKINAKTYQLAFEPKGDLRHIWFMRMTNSLRTITYNYTGGDYLVSDCFKPKDNTEHLIDEKLDLLEFIGMVVDERDRIPKLHLSNTLEFLVDTFVKDNNLQGKRVIGLHPGASNINKQFRYYPQLMEKISEELTSKDVICVFEGPGEAEIVDKVCHQLGELNINYIRVKKNTKEYVALVSVCRLMICNDSAAGHIAASYGIPCVVIFGPVKPETALPRGTGTIEFISHSLECKPCTLPVCPLGTEECIREISLTEVTSIVIKQLAQI